MATGWIPVGVSTPRCTEVVRIASKTKKSRRETFAALVEFWIWVSQESADGVLDGYSLDSLPHAIEGTDCRFWCAVADEGWIEVTDTGLVVPENKEHQFITKGGRARALKSDRQGKWKAKSAKKETLRETVEEALAETRDETDFDAKASRKASPKARPTETVTVTEDFLQKSKVSQNRTSIGEKPVCPDLSEADLLEISGEEVSRSARLAGSFFERAKYTGDDGSLLWKIAVLVGRGIVPESLAHDAAEGAKLNAKRNPVGFLRKTLAETCAKRGIDLDREIARLRMPRGSPTGKPKCEMNSEIRSLVSGIGEIK